MRQNTSTEVIGGIETEHEAAYHISKSAEVHIMRILRDMYTDPVKAVLREFIANGVDSQNEAGNDEPMEIVLPNKFESTLTFRDYGTGLTSKEFERYILGYGETGARKLSDRNQIGGFGIGCKSFFAISSSAVFTIYKDGTETVWLCQPDRTDRGSAKMISTAASEEPNGVKVEIPMDNTIYSEGIRNKLEGVIQYMDRPFKIDGEVHNIYQERTVLENFIIDKEFDAFNSVCRVRVGNSDTSKKYIKIVINGIPYGISSTYVSDVVSRNDLGKEWATKLLSRNTLVLNAPEGCMELAPNRESFIENTRTEKGLVILLKEAFSIIQKEVSLKFEECDDIDEALHLAHEMDKAGLFHFYNSHVNRYSSFLRSGVFKCMHTEVPYKKGTTSIVKDRCIHIDDLKDLDGKIWLCGWKKRRKEVSFKGPIINTKVMMPFEDETLYSNVTDEFYTQEFRYDDIPFEKKSPFMGFIKNNRIRHRAVCSEIVIFNNKIRVYTTSSESEARKMTGAFTRHLYAKHGGPHSPMDTRHVFYPYIVLIDNDETRKFVKKYAHILDHQGSLKDNFGHLISKRKARTSSAKKSVGPRKSPLYKYRNDTHYYYQSSTAWEKVEKEDVPDKKFLYAVLDFYEIVDPKIRQYRGLRVANMSDTLKTLKFILPASKHDILNRGVYGIKWSDRKKVPSNGVELTEYVQDIKKKWFINDKGFAVSPTQILYLNTMRTNGLAGLLLSNMRRFVYNISCKDRKLITSRFHDRHIIRKYMKRQCEFLHMPPTQRNIMKGSGGTESYANISTEIGKAHAWAGSTTKDKFYEEEKEYIDKIRQMYPLITKIFGEPVHNIAMEDTKDVLDYVKGMDKVNNRK